MRKITFEIGDELYNYIEELKDWLNLNLKVKDKGINGNYTVNELLKGIIVTKLEEIKHFKEINPYLNTEISKSTNIKNNFKQIANEVSIKQKDIAKMIGVRPPAINAIFNNESQPRMELFIKIWIILGCPDIHDCIYIEDQA